MQKELDWLKIWLLVKNPQFLSNQADLQATLPTHELKILSKFHEDWKEIVDFLLIAKLWASQVFCISLYTSSPMMFIQQIENCNILEQNICLF